MDGINFDMLTRSLTAVSSRRRLIYGLLGAGLGVGDAPLLRVGEAKKKRKRKKKREKSRPNAFGCVAVGNACQNVEQCCSGICDGKKGKRTCRAHGAGSCAQDGSGVCTQANPGLLTCDNDSSCRCVLTTAGSSFCARGFFECVDCRRDADCLALGFSPESACAPVTAGLCAGACASGMACVIPCGEKPPA
jgi:hypothetical protein